MKKIQLLLIVLLIVKTGISQTSTQNFKIEGNSYEYEQLNEVENPEALLVLFNGGAGKAAYSGLSDPPIPIWSDPLIPEL